MRTQLSCWLAVLLLLPAMTQAGQAQVAVAANFTAAMKELAADFQRDTGHTLRVSYGSTGKLYTQIENGAPFDVFLAADQARPARLLEKGLASRPFTYAVGRLVLWSRDAGRAVHAGTLAGTLATGDFRRLAIANPKTAPYGRAAVEVMQALQLYPQLKPRLVTGESIAQTQQFVATGNAELGFVALAQVVLHDGGSRWDIPQELYTPIRQDAVLLKRAENNPAALALLDYLKTPAAREVIGKFGYGLAALNGPG